MRMSYIGAETPCYIGITNDTIRRSGEHAASGRLNIKPTDDDPTPGVLRPLQSDVTYGEARGYEQYYIDQYGTRTGTIGEEISQDNRGISMKARILITEEVDAKVKDMGME